MSWKYYKVKISDDLNVSGFMLCTPYLAFRFLGKQKSFKLVEVLFHVSS